MDHSTNISRQDVLETMLDCSAKFRDIRTDLVYLNFHGQINAKHDQLSAGYFPLFKKISRETNNLEAHRQIGIQTDHDYKIYMNLVLKGQEENDAFETLNYFLTYPSTDILLTRHDMQMKMIECFDFSEEIGIMINNTPKGGYWSSRLSGIDQGRN